MPFTPRIAEWNEQLVTYVHRGIMVTELIARKLGQKDTEKSLRTLLIEYETTLNCKPDDDVEAKIRTMKVKE